MNKLFLTIFIILMIMLSTGCERKETLAPAKPKVEPGTEKKLLIGLIPEQNIFKQMERYQPLADTLSKRIGMKVQLTVLPRYGNIINSFVSSGMDGAFFGSFSYALAHEKLGVEVLARPLDLNGTSTYYGLIFVRKDSGIKSIRQMKGKRFALVDKATTAGYLLPLAFFKKHGENYKTFLKESYLAGTHEDAILDVLNKKADVGAAKNTVFERMAASDEKFKKELVILERSPEVPENGLAVRKDLEGSLKEKLKETLLTIHDDPEGQTVLKTFGAQRFIETKDSDYLPVYRYAKEIDLTLATYDYIND